MTHLTRPVALPEAITPSDTDIAAHLGALDLWWNSPYRPLLLPTTPANADLSHWRRSERPNAGKSPGLRDSTGRWQPLDLTAYRPARAELAAVLADGGSLALRTGVKCKELGGAALLTLDIDVEEEAVSAAMKAIITRITGAAPLRIGAAPRLALVYRAHFTLPTRNWEMRVPIAGAAGELHALRRAQFDVLSTNLRFIVQGTHKRTGRPYRWPDGVLHSLDPAEIPVITRKQLAEIMAACGRFIGGQGGVLATPTDLSYAIHRAKMRYAPWLPPLGLLRRLPQAWFYTHFGAGAPGNLPAPVGESSLHPASQNTNSTIDRPPSESERQVPG